MSRVDNATCADERSLRIGKRTVLCLTMEGLDGSEMNFLNPFSSEDLWRLSKFTLQSLQPLEPLPWNEELPGK